MIYDLMKRHPEIQETVQDAQELQLDTTELLLSREIDKGEPWAVLYYLKTQGRARGYIEKQDVMLDAVTLEELVLLSLKLDVEDHAKA